MGNMKETLLAKIKEIKIQHPRAADYLAKISRSDDCFALMFDANHDTCKSCLIKATYEGKEYEMKDLCAHFMQFALVKPEEAAAAPAAADAIPEGRKVPEENAPPAVEEKKAAKKEKAPKAPAAPKEEKVKGSVADDVLSENEEKVLKLVKKGTTSGTAIAKEIDVWPSQAYGILDKLIERGLVEKKKAEKGKGSAFFPKA